MRSRCSARIISSRWTASVSRASSSASSRARPRTLDAARPRARPGPAARRRARRTPAATDASMRASAARAASRTERGDDRAARTRRAGGLLPARGPRARSRRRAAAARRGRRPRGRAPRRCARPAGRPSRPAGAAATSACSASRSLGVGLVRLVGLRLGQVQPLLEVGQAGEVAVAGVLGSGAGLVQPGRLGAGLAGRLAELGQLLGHRGEPGVGLVQRLERLLDLGACSCGRRSRDSASWALQPLVPGGGLVGLLRAPRRRRPGSRSRVGADDDPPAAQPVPRTSPSRVTTRGVGVGRPGRRARRRGRRRRRRRSSRRRRARRGTARVHEISGSAARAPDGSPVESGPLSAAHCRRRAGRRGRRPRP